MAALAVPKRVLVHNKPIRFRFLQQTIWGFLAANAGAMIVSALYYIFVQVKWPGATYSGHPHTVLYLKPYWDNLFSFSGWSADRHDIRNVYEAVFATLFVKSLLANWKKSKWEAPAWYVALSPVLILVAAAIPVVLGVFVLNHAGPWIWHQWIGTHKVANPVHLNHTLSWLATYLTGFPWQPAVIGILAGLVVHRVYAPAGDTVQAYFVGRTVDRTRDAINADEKNPYRHMPRWPMPPVVRERAWWIMQAGEKVPDRSRSIRWAVWSVALTLGALAGYGVYIRYVVAKGH